MRALEVSVGLVIRQRFDYHVSFRSEARSSGKVFSNYAMSESRAKKVPTSSAASQKGLEGRGLSYLFHLWAGTRSSLNGTYNLLDLVPKSHDEDGVDSGMA